MRDGEINGKDYHYNSLEEFKNLLMKIISLNGKKFMKIHFMELPKQKSPEFGLWENSSFGY